jgi:hypothetical protein
MPKIPISHARPGQKLARAITTSSGVLMMQAGAELTASAIARLRNLGIDTVSIADDTTNAGRDGPSLEERIHATERRFEGHEGDAWMMGLREIVLRQLRHGSPPAHG